MLLALILAAGCLVGCSKSSSPSSTTSSTPSAASSSAPANDAVQQKLQELAGSGAADCGRHDIKAQNPELNSASDCAQNAARNKKPFYVAYDMPGMTTAVAGNAEGKLFAVELQGSGTGAKLDSGPCPAALRVASSGRLTCFTPGSMSLNGNDPHASMGANPGAANPHAGSGFPQPMASPPSKK